VAMTGDDYVTILKNNGYGGFPGSIYCVVEDVPVSVFCADLDKDSDWDIAVANQGSNDISILKNNGDGTFMTAINYAVADSPAAVYCADLDGDGNVDIAVANKGSDNVSTLKNNGDGTFQSAINYPDGDMDIAVTNQGSDNISILENNGDGTFQSAVEYAAGSDPTSVFCADLDGDGDMDIAVVGHSYVDNIHILKNLTQMLANFPPQSFSLISPQDNDSISRIVDFHWAIPYDPNLGDQIRYDLYKTHISFGAMPETTMIIDSNLVKSRHTDTLEVGSYYWKVKAKDNWGAEVWSTQTWHFVSFIRGDVRGDGTLDIGDVVMLLNYLFKEGTTPDPLSSGDVNCDYTVDVGDVVYLINYLFKDGPPPSC
jgi:hypothetical protein